MADKLHFSRVLPPRELFSGLVNHAIPLMVLAALTGCANTKSEAPQANSMNSAIGLAPEPVEVANAFQESLLLGCIGFMGGVVAIPEADEAAANSVRLSIGAPKDIDQEDLLPLSLDIPGGTKLFERPMNDGFMVLAVGQRKCRIGVYDTPSPAVETAVVQVLTATGSPWELAPQPDNATASYRWEQKPYASYLVNLRPKLMKLVPDDNRADRLTYVVEVIKE